MTDDAPQPSTPPEDPAIRAALHYWVDAAPAAACTALLGMLIGLHQAAQLEQWRPGPGPLDAC